MKYILFLLVLFTNSVLAQFAGTNDLVSNYQTTQLEYNDSAGKYVIAYRYCTDDYFVPLITGSTPHHYAEITVYELNKINGSAILYELLQLGESFQGIYVPGGCFEDVPAEWVRKAKQGVYIKACGSLIRNNFSDDSTRRMRVVFPYNEKPMSIKIDSSFTKKVNAVLKN